ncbi:hypothetical protein N9Y00_07050 [Tateyamaria sp.]|nr:hypothetical protein [Tateyamaria sp.]
MTTTETLLHNMFVERTGHSLIDSGDFYGRAYQSNAKRDLKGEPQATMIIGEWGVEISVSTFHHLLACLELDRFCEEFNALPCEEWNSDYFAISADQQTWLEDRGFYAEDNAWNSCNWENNFDQTVHGHKIERDGEEYVLLSMHGGCDVRSGYTDAKLFKIQDWMNDYFMRDDSRFDIPRESAERAGLPVSEVSSEYGYDAEWVSATVWGYVGHATIYDPRVSNDVAVPKSFWDDLPHQRIEGVQDAVEH